MTQAQLRDYAIDSQVLFGHSFGPIMPGCSCQSIFFCHYP
uniref:Uncharacterized protein n=1 Tax=uncultured soil microorganism TaxID=1457551 RepID=W5XJX1_9ZZZZ|nr:hypothetical protein AEP_T1_17 [uncultured soil microorganism]